MKTTPNNNDQLALNIKSRQYGYSLIEVMIAAFLLSFAILGITGLQIIGMKGTHQSLMKQQAMGIVQNITERMRANNTSLTSYQFNSDNINCNSAPPDCTTNACSLSQIAKLDINNIVCGYGNNTAALKSSSGPGILLNGSLKVECVGGSCNQGDMRITVGWIERELGKESSAPTANSLVLTTRIVQ